MRLKRRQMKSDTRSFTSKDDVALVTHTVIPVVMAISLSKFVHLINDLMGSFTLTP